MKFFLDTANVEAIREINKLGVVDGVTTNPSIISREGRDFETVIKEICSIVSGPVSAEVTGLTTDEMVSEARNIAKWADNVVVKIPMTVEGLKAVNILSQEGIKTNVTLIFSVSQGLMAMKPKLSLSIRSLSHVENVARLGSHIATIPDGLFENMTKHPLTNSGLEAFMKDWEAFKK